MSLLPYRANSAVITGLSRVGLYNDRIVPHLVRMSMRQPTLTPYRQRAMSAAEGRVLELGIGSGMNIPYYPERVVEVIGLDPSARLLAMAEQETHGRRSVQLLRSSAERIPLDDSSVDTVVTTWTLCSIPDVVRALSEARRVLKPSGRLVFAEHGRSSEEGVRRWQDRLTPFWKRIAGGCHLNRAIDRLIEESGFRIEQIATGYMPGPKPMTFMYEGRARPA
jgi:ubiquinone/menaquinone biosynthesis C-methylase UbiE